MVGYMKRMQKNESLLEMWLSQTEGLHLHQ